MITLKYKQEGSLFLLLGRCRTPHNQGECGREVKEEKKGDLLFMTLSQFVLRRCKKLTAFSWCWPLDGMVLITVTSSTAYSREVYVQYCMISCMCPWAKLRRGETRKSQSANTISHISSQLIQNILFSVYCFDCNYTIR